ncbi:ribonuclease H-like domain-containing protein [Tanacetum coccineum]
MIQDLGKLKYFLGIKVIDADKGICLNQRNYVLDLLSEYGMLVRKPAKTPLMSKLIISNEASDIDHTLDSITDYQKLMVIMEYFVNISKMRAFWSLNEDILKITILKTNTPYPSRKIRRIRACTHQRPQRNEAQYAKYVVEILGRAHMVNCNPSRTPIDTESKLGSDGDPVFDPTLYRSLAGSLQYFTFTRLDISYDVRQVCLHMHDPREPHFYALKRILRYVRDTLDYGLRLFSSSTTDLVAYSDADWADYPTTRRSTSGYCVFLGNNLLSWSSKRQPMLSRSSAEAEYRGVANVVAETYLIAAGQVQVLHVPSRYQFVDIFTKGLPSALFEEFRSSLSAWCPPAPTAWEC